MTRPDAVRSAQIAIHSPTGQQAKALAAQLVTVYRDAFRAPPYSKRKAEVLDLARSLPQHVAREGFHIVTAVEVQTDQVVGFAYGYANTPDQVWHEAVAPAMSPPAAEWLAHSFRLVQLAVAPPAQGQGIGGCLHDHLLRSQSYQKAVLSTLAAETTAYRLYRSRGWVVLLDSFFFPGVARAYRIMGLKWGGKEKTIQPDPTPRGKMGRFSVSI